MTRPFAQRLNRLGTETAFEVLAKAKALEAQGREVIHLEIGEPDFDTPSNIVEAGRQALSDGWTHYGPAQGLPELRQVVADEITKTRGRETSPDEVLICPGAKPVMFYLLLALAERGDEVLYPNPGFPIYESMIDFSGATAVPVPLLEEKGFAFTAETIRELVTDQTKLIILNSPSNPTGGILDEALIAEIAKIAVEKDLWVLSDEIYSRVIYDGEMVSISTYPGMKERTIILDGWSKTYAMTGWRLGFAVGPTEIIQHMTKLQVNSVSCTAGFSQRAAMEALSGPQDGPDEMLKVFETRRDAIVKGLNDLPGVSCIVPKGAFYAFPNIKDTGISSQEFADRLLQEADVAVLSGTSFGRYGEGYLRLSYANSLENIEKALDKMRSFLGSL